MVAVATVRPALAVARNCNYSASLRSEFRSLSGPARLLVINGFGGSVGFYMVLPFLAVYLREDLGYGAAVVGLVLGLLTLSQQGMFPIGGVAADRIGCRPMIIAGCGLRVVAFGLFAAFTSLPGIITATVLTGLGAALFGPAARTYLLAESRGRRAQTFAVYSVFANAGALVGPLLVALLLTVDFRVVALVAGVVFVLSTVVTIAGQIRITTWCQARWSTGTSLAVGLSLQGAGFLPLMISSPWLDTNVGAGSVGAAALAMIPVLIGAVVLTAGLAITFPFIMTLLPVVGSERLAGTYYGASPWCPRSSRAWSPGLRAG